jgi:methylenetetrahydrofolate reductase (NADPH)
VSGEGPGVAWAPHGPRSSRSGSSRPSRRRSWGAVVESALREASYEVLPLRNAEDAVVEHVPRDVPLTITTTEAKGLTPTIDLADRLSRHGFAATPHLAARLVRDRAHLTDIVARLRAAGVNGVFVVAGDAAEPAGTFTDALSLLEQLEVSGHHFQHVGIGGYPEGHGHISAELIERALERKAPHATHIVTQLCFHPSATTAWARQVKQRGVNLPIRIGLPGAVTRQKLVRISAGLGLGQSARFLLKQHSMFWRFFLPHGYQPGSSKASRPPWGTPSRTCRASTSSRSTRWHGRRRGGRSGWLACPTQFPGNDEAGSHRRQTAVDGKGLAGDVPGPVGGKEDDRRRDVLGGALSAQRHLLLDELAEFALAQMSQDRIVEAGLNPSGADAVDPDPVTGVLDRQLPGDVDQRALGRVVCDQIRQAWAAPVARLRS